MRRKIVWGAWLLTAWLALTPTVAKAQPGAAGYAPAEPGLTTFNPLGSTRPEEAFYLYGGGLLFRQTNPLKHQLVAVRGFIATDDSVLGPGTAGLFVGSRTEAFNVREVSGPGTYQPGFEVGAGWRFSDGSTLTLDWLFLSTAEFRATATSAPLLLRVGSTFSESFLTAFVFNFPPEYSGPAGKIIGASPFAAYGIWNGASVMTQEFQQRFQQWSITYRFPVHEEENYRFQGMMGPRFAWFWERYKWRTTSLDGNGASGPLDNGIYTNTISNRMYGAFIGCHQEWYLGHGFACSLDARASLFVDSAREIAKYELGDKFEPPQNRRSRREYTIAPALDAALGIKYYPIEFVELSVGYNFMAFFNTISSPRPIDFNYSNLTPKYESQNRFLDGFSFGMAIKF